MSLYYNNNNNLVKYGMKGELIAKFYIEHFKEETFINFNSDDKYDLLTNKSTYEIKTDSNYIKYNYKIDTDNTIDINYKVQKLKFLYNKEESTIVSLINNNETFQSVILYTNKYNNNNNISTRLQFPYIHEYDKHNYLNFTINITNLYTSNIIFIEMNYNDDVNISISNDNFNVNNNNNHIVIIWLITFLVLCLLSILIVCFVYTLK